MTSQRKKKPFFGYKNRIFESPKNRISFQRGSLMIVAKKWEFFLHLHLVKIRQEILLSDFAEKKETFFWLQKQNFSKFKKSHFSKGANPWFWTKNANYEVHLDLVKIGLEIMLSDFAQ